MLAVPVLLIPLIGIHELTLCLGVNPLVPLGGYFAAFAGHRRRLRARRALQHPASARAASSARYQPPRPPRLGRHGRRLPGAPRRRGRRRAARGAQAAAPRATPTIPTSCACSSTRRGSPPSCVHPQHRHAPRRRRASGRALPGHGARRRRAAVTHAAAARRRGAAARRRRRRRGRRCRWPTRSPTRTRMTDESGRPLELVHRDVSPHNVLVDRTAHVKLADFGIARSLDGGAGADTRTGVMKGKLSYMAPEQLQSTATISASTSTRSASCCSRCCRTACPTRARRSRRCCGASSRTTPSRGGAPAGSTPRSALWCARRRIPIRPQRIQSAAAAARALFAAARRSRAAAPSCARARRARPLAAESATRGRRRRRRRRPAERRHYFSSLKIGLSCGFIGGMWCDGGGTFCLSDDGPVPTATNCVVAG